MIHSLAFLRALRASGSENAIPVLHLRDIQCRLLDKKLFPLSRKSLGSRYGRRWKSQELPDLLGAAREDGSQEAEIASRS